MNEVRVWFSKTDSAKYISHLDLMRYFTRAIRRAKLPVWNTEGFNPHPYINFGLPMSLGFEGVCECFDIKITEEMPLGDIKSELSKVMTDSIEIVEVTTPVQKTKFIAFAEYMITFDLRCKDLILEFLNQESIIVSKKEKQIDIKPDINKFSVSEDEKTILKIILPSSPVKNINPLLLINAFCAKNGIPIPKIIRKMLLTEKLEKFR